MYMKLSDKNQPFKFLEENYIALDMAIEALEQEPCEDCDYSEIMDWEQDAKTGKAKPIYWCERHKEPKTGHWIPIYQGDEIINYRCSECELGDTNGSTNLYGWDYCRRCGAKMVEPICDTCKYNTASFMPCNACEDKSEYESQESEVSDADSN